MRDSPATEANVGPRGRTLDFSELGTLLLARCILQRRIVCRHIFTFGAALAALSVSVDSGAQAATGCDYNARLAEPNTVWIDANSGAILSSATQFHTHRQRVNLHFVNKNPFGFTYTFEVKGRALEESVIQSALKTIAGVLSEEAQTTAQDESGLLYNEIQECSGDVKRKIDGVHQTRETLKAALASFNQVAGEYNDLIGKISPALPTDEESCNELAHNAKGAIRRVAIAEDHQRTVNESQEELVKGITELRAAAAREKSDCLKRLQAVIGESTAHLKEVEGVQKEIDARMKIIQANKELLINELARPDAFVTSYPIGPVTEPTEYSVNIERTSRLTNARTTAAASAPIRLGQARFSFSAGIAFGFADQKNYVRQASVVNGDVKNIVGVDEESDTQVGVVGQLNGRLFGNDNVSVLWSLGASLTHDHRAPTIYQRDWAKSCGAAPTL